MPEAGLAGNVCVSDQGAWQVQGFPSIGDEQSTVPVPKEKWFEYGGERSGRFQNMTNADGSAKTECGIHVMSDATSEKGPAAELASATR